MPSITPTLTHPPPHTHTVMWPRSVCPSFLPTNAWPTWTSSNFRYVLHGRRIIIVIRREEGWKEKKQCLTKSMLLQKQKQADVLACVQKYVKITPEQAVSIKGMCVRARERMDGGIWCGEHSSDS